jgi:lysozyme family protein
MSADGFERALALVLAHEGGFSDHPRDPGGATNLGVTQRVYDAWRAGRGLARRPVRGIGTDEARAIYRHQYWDAVHGDDLPPGLDYAEFDYAVNSGPGKAVRDLQREAGAAPDGKVGVLTLQAVRAADARALIAGLCARRLRYLKTLRTWAVFGRGWSRRVAEAGQAALSMADGPDAAPAPSPAPPAMAAPAKAPPADVAASRTPIGKGGLITALGGAGVTAKAVADTVSGTGKQVAPHLDDGFLGHAAVVVLLAVAAAGLAVIAYHVWVLCEEQHARRRPPTLLGFLAELLSPPGGGGGAGAANGPGGQA